MFENSEDKNTNLLTRSAYYALDDSKEDRIGKKM